MILKIKHFVVFVTIIFLSCKHSSSNLSSIAAKQLKIDSSLVNTSVIENFILPYRNRIDEVLDSTLAYAPRMITKEDGKYNTSAGNLLADIILSESKPIFKSRTGKNVDFVLLNHGGIRSIISKGKVTARTAYQVMPFENSIVVVELSGESILAMADFLIKTKRAHPIAGIQLVINGNEQLKTLKINGQAFDKSRNYYVATSNYLVTGGDNMGFFKNMISSTDTDYLIRNAMIDYFKKVDTVTAAVDNRFYKTN